MDIIVIMCPPLADYNEAPKDQSESHLIDCPKCNEKMWLSSKKKGWLLYNALLNKEILFTCYRCLKKMAENDPEMFRDHVVTNI